MTEVRDAKEPRVKQLRYIVLSAQGFLTLLALIMAVGWSLCLVSALPSCAGLGAGYQHSVWSEGKTHQQLEEEYLASYRPTFYGLAVLGWVGALLFLALTWPLSWWASRRLRRGQGNEPQQRCLDQTMAKN